MILSLQMILLGMAAGISAGFFGIGGGVIIVTGLILLFKFTQAQANGISLVALLLPVGLLGVYEYYKAGKITGENIKLGLWIALGIFMGTLIGSKIAVGLSEKTLRISFAIFLIVMALRMILSKS